MRQLIVSSENENTRKSMNYLLNVFQKWTVAREAKQCPDWFHRKCTKNFTLHVMNMSLHGSSQNLGFKFTCVFIFSNYFPILYLEYCKSLLIFVDFSTT